MSNMNTKKSFKTNHDYDVENDSLFIYIIDDYIYDKSLRLDKDVILDFDENKVPVALELLHASKLFNVNRFDLRNPMGLDMEITIGDKCIRIKADFTILVRNKPTPLDLDIEGENSINIPSQETHFDKAVA